MPGVKDRVAVVGVGCTKFGELWEKDQEDLLVEAVYEALDDAGLTPEDVDAGWVGLMYNFTGFAGAAPRARPAPFPLGPPAAPSTSGAGPRRTWPTSPSRTTRTAPPTLRPT